MQRLSFLATLGVASLALAQSPLTTLTGGTNLGNVGGGIYFDLEVVNPLTLNQIDYLCSANTVAGTGTIDVYLGPGTYLGNATTPSQWVLVTSSVPSAVAPSTMANGVLATPIGLAPGRYGVAIKANGSSHGYTNGVACTSTTVPGACGNSLFSNADLIFRGGSASNVFQTLPTFQPRIFNGAFHYTLGGTPTPVASWQGVGVGCYGRWSSFYEVFANPAGLDFGTGFTQSLLLTLVPAENRYNVTVGTNAVVPPAGTPVTIPATSAVISAAAALGGVAGGPLPSGNVILHPGTGGTIVGATDLQIATAGYISPQAAAITNDTTPTAAEVLSGPIRWMPHWKNITPFTAVAPNGLYVEEDLANGQLRVTYQAIPDNTTTSTFQVVYHYASGNVEYRYDVMSVLGGGSFPVIVGWTLGAGALDRGSMDITAEAPFATAFPDNQPLRLALGARPLLGTNPVFTISDHEAAQPLGALLVGFVGIPAGASLAGLGMPECFNYAPLATSFSNTYFPVSRVGTINFPIPNDVGLLGVTLWSQAAALGSSYNTAFGIGVNASNGLVMRVGNL